MERGCVRRANRSALKRAAIKRLQRNLLLQPILSLLQNLSFVPVAHGKFFRLRAFYHRRTPGQTNFRRIYHGLVIGGFDMSLENQGW